MNPFGGFGKPGLLRVALPGEEFRDFDAEEWSYEWRLRGDVTVLLLKHDGAPEASSTFDFVEFPAPVSVEFIREE